MRRLGLPAEEDRYIHFTVWKSTSSGWSVAKAEYDWFAGAELTLCQVIVVIDASSHVHVLREEQLHKTDAETPTNTAWSPLDLADVDGDGRIDIVLEADAYENHWLEVDSLQDGSFRTIFSGLGYYL